MSKELSIDPVGTTNACTSVALTNKSKTRVTAHSAIERATPEPEATALFGVGSGADRVRLFAIRLNYESPA